MKKLGLKSILAVIFIALGANFAQAQSHSHSSHFGLHGMVMFGKEKIYLSHLPMFHAPHDYQFVFEAELSDEAKIVVAQAKSINPGTLITVVPELFDLVQMGLQPKPFQAAIYLGHFERGGKVIVPAAQIKVKEVLLFQQLDLKPQAGRSGVLMVFGTPTEIFGVHLINGAPGFDQIVEISPTQKILERLALEKTFSVQSLQRLPTPFAVGPVVMILKPILPRGSVEIETIHIKETLYLEQGDLAH